MTTKRKKIGKFLAIARARAAEGCGDPSLFTQRRVGMDLDINPMKLWAIERGRRKLDTSLFFLLAKHYDVKGKELKELMDMLSTMKED